MKTTVLLLTICAFILSCGNPQADLSAKIDSLALKVYNDSTKRVDTEMAKNYIAACEEYANKFPKDSLSPVLLLKAAETSRNIGNFDEALKIYDLVISDYSDYDKAPQAMFLKAFTVDDNMGKKEEAKVIYEAFLEKYPNDEFAESAKFMLENLYKSDAEIIQGFEKKDENIVQ